MASACSSIKNELNRAYLCLERNFVNVGVTLIVASIAASIIGWGLHNHTQSFGTNLNNCVLRVIGTSLGGIVASVTTMIKLMNKHFDREEAKLNLKPQMARTMARQDSVMGMQTAVQPRRRSRLPMGRGTPANGVRGNYRTS